MDYQSRANGGDGWLRYFTFKPSENRIYAYTYSPTRNNGLGEFETDDSSQFVLDYDMQGAPFTVIGTGSNVPSGSESSIEWSGLAEGTEYEWYVSVNDGQKTTTGPVWSFTTRTRENAAPLAIDDLHVLAEDTVLTVAAPGVLGNDIDVDGDPLTAVVTGSPGHGVVTLDANGRFVYTPHGNYSGADSFTYQASDGTRHSNVASVNVVVTPVNDVPDATAETYNATADIALIVPAPGVLANDSDVESSVLMAMLVKAPDHGTLLLNTNGSFAYTATGTSQTDSFSYVASDGQSTSNVVTVSLAITIPTVPVPDVVNLTVAAATIAITNAGLTIGTVTTEQSASIPAGSIISQNPAAGALVRPPAPVSLVVSSGAPPPPVTLAVDKVVTSFGTGTRTTAPFSTATAGEVLVAFVASDGPSTSQSLTVTGAGLTWTLVRRVNVQRGASEIWTATATNQLSNVTVTSRQTVMGYTQSLTVVAFRGAAGVGASAAANGATGAPSVTLNATTAGSFVYGVGNDWDRAVARVLGPGQTMVHQWLDTASGDTYWVQALSTPVTAPGPVRLNDTSPTTDRWNMAAVEIVPK
jgi:VCBS repeat-containing protein